MRTQLRLTDFDAVIFDLDGTLVDSMWMWTDIDIEYLDRFGIGFEKQIQREIEGLSVYETAIHFKNKFGISDPIEVMMQDWLEMSVERYRNEVRLKSYVSGFLTLVSEHGIPMGIASSNSRQALTACLEANSVADRFGVIVTSDEVKKGKPNPDVYLEAARRLGVDPKRCIAFEDIPAGIAAAKAAGMFVVGVYDKYSEDLTEQKKAMADLYIEDFGEMIELFSDK